MAKWGRRGWRFPLQWGRQRSVWRSQSFKKIKTMKWGSPAASSNSGPRRHAAKAKWGSRAPIFSFAMIRRGRKKAAVSWSKQATGQQRPKGRLKKRRVLLFLLAFMLLFSIPSFIFIERNLRPPLMVIAKVRVKQIATQAINKAITDQVARSSNSEKLIDWKMNDKGKISGFMLNYGEHMRITSATIDTVQTTLKDIQNIPEHIPIGHALNSAIISSFGPRVPVRFEPVGAVKVELNTRQKNAGINMILVEVYIKVIAEVTIIIPFDTEPELVETDIPISYLLVVGDVPMYYYDNTGKPIGESAPQAPSISVPLAPGAGISAQTEEEEAAAPVLTEPIEGNTAPQGSVK